MSAPARAPSGSAFTLNLTLPRCKITHSCGSTRHFTGVDPWPSASPPHSTCCPARGDPIFHDTGTSITPPPTRTRPPSPPRPPTADGDGVGGSNAWRPPVQPFQVLRLHTKIPVEPGPTAPGVLWAWGAPCCLPGSLHRTCSMSLEKLSQWELSWQAVISRGGH